MKKCPFHTIEDGAYGYKIYIGGRWGKKVSMGKELGKIFTFKEEALDVIEKAILFFRDNGIKGECFAESIERIGFENVEKQLYGQLSKDVTQESHYNLWKCSAKIK